VLCADTQGWPALSKTSHGKVPDGPPLLFEPPLLLLEPPLLVEPPLLLVEPPLLLAIPPVPSAVYAKQAPVAAPSDTEMNTSPTGPTERIFFIATVSGRALVRGSEAAV
jgi:hypothetical protein